MSVVDDIEIITIELIENVRAQLHLKLSSSEHAQLIELLLLKAKEFRKTLKRADKQAKINLKIQGLKNEVATQDMEIQKLRKELKEAERILATAVYVAKPKLQSIARANKRQVAFEELTKYSHMISAFNAICAPLSLAAS